MAIALPLRPRHVSRRKPSLRGLALALALPCAAAVAPAGAGAAARADETPAPAARILVRFADDADVGAVADRLREAGLPFAGVTGDGGLDALNERFGAVRYRRLVLVPAGAATQAVPAARLDRAAARAERLERRARFEERVSATARRHPARARRAPAGARVPYLDHLFSVELAAGTDTEAAARAWSREASVRYAVPDRLNKTSAAPDDPYYASRGSWGQDYDDQWALKKLQPEAAWDRAQGDGVVVAVVDTGVDAAHEDLAANVLRDALGAVVGYDFSDRDDDPSDEDGHGTHVAGTIAAVAGNAVGIAGVAPRARIMPAKIFPDAYDSVAVEALVWAADHGADVLNNSWGPNGRRPSNPAVEEAVEYAHALGCVVVFAAGNDADDVSLYSPANHPLVVAVASTDRADRKSDFSNHGDAIRVSAPGGDSRDATPAREYLNVLSLRAGGTDLCGDGSCTVGGAYVRARGTSMAAPHAAGVAALVLSEHPAWSNLLVAAQLAGTADPIDALNPGFEGRLGTGRLNAARALAEAPGLLLRHARTAVLDDRPGNARVDGLLDPGERAGLAFTLLNVWAPALAAQARLVSEDPRVVVEKALASFGDAATGANLSNAADPFEVALAAEVAPGSRLGFLLEVSDSGGLTTTLRLSVAVPLATLPGFPLAFPAGERTSDSVVLADLDGDGHDEALFGRDTEVHAVRGDGSALPGWPRSLAGGGDHAPRMIAAGDLDGDGAAEVIAVSAADAPAPDNAVHAWSAGGAPLPGWPVAFGADRVHALALGDLDGDPADLEVVLVRAVAVPGPGVEALALDGDGTPLDGWPYRFSGSGFSPLLRAGLAIGDADRDGASEVVVTGAIPGTSGGADGWVSVHGAGGLPLAGWPKLLVFGGPSHPLVANVDGGEDLEIVVPEWIDADPGLGLLRAYKYNGSAVPGWPVLDAGWTVPAAADLDGDGQMEIVGADLEGGVVRLWRRTAFEAWLRRPPPVTGPLLCDVDGGGSPEALFGSPVADLAAERPQGVAALDAAGNAVPGFPALAGAHLVAPPALGDLDGDGRLDLVAMTGEAVRAWALGVPAPADRPWPLAFHDAARSSRSDPPAAGPSATLAVAAEGDGEVSVNGAARPLPWTERYRQGWVVPIEAMPHGGSYFEGWTGDLAGKGPAASLGMTQDRSATAVFRACLDLATAVDAPGLAWSTGGQAPWCGMPGGGWAGDSAARSGEMPDGVYPPFTWRSWAEIAVTGPAVVAFAWKVSSDPVWDTLAVQLDGVELAQISGAQDWAPAVVEVPAGEHAVRWEYAKDFLDGVGEDAGWIDGVRVVPLAEARTLALDAVGAGRLRAGGVERVLPAAVHAPDGWAIGLEALADDGWRFDAWGGDLAGTANPALVVLDGDKSVTAAFVPWGVALAEALDAPALAFESGGARPWFGEGSSGAVGEDDAASGSLVDGETSWIAATVEGPATVRFRWKVSCEWLFDALVFRVDGAVAASIDGEVDWEPRERAIPAGTHLLRWEYVKDYSVSDGADRAWLDAVEVVPELPPAAATGPAVGVTSTGALLTGTATPASRAATARFEYGATAGYGSATPEAAVGGGNAPVAVEAPVTDLAPNTELHYRLVVTDATGAASGDDASFRTEPFRYVDPAGLCGSREPCAPSLFAALGAAGDGETIRVAAGRYEDGLLLARAATLSVEGGWDPAFTVRSADPAATLVDCGDRPGDTVRVIAVPGQRVVLALDGLTLAGNGPGRRLHVRARGGTAAVDLRRVVVRGDAAADGGGIEVRAVGGGRATLALADTMVVGNRGASAGAVMIGASGAGGLARVAATHATISGNAGASRGGVVLLGERGGRALLKLRNSVLRGNRDAAGEPDDLFLSRSGTGAATASALASDVGAVVPDPLPGRAGVFLRGPGCFDADPLFLRPALGDYRLRAGSPCVDRGSSRFATPLDFEGQRRQPKRPDVGADERPALR